MSIRNQQFLIITAILLVFLMMAGCGSLSEQAGSNNGSNTGDNNRSGQDAVPDSQNQGTANNTNSGSNEGETRPAPPKISEEPVKLLAAIDAVIIDPGYEELIQNELKQKHPYITLEIVQPGEGSRLTDMLAAGIVPDLIFTYNGKLPAYEELELLYDMNDLIKKHQIDLGRFEDNMIVDAKVASKNDELYGLPYGTNFHALYYNIDIFDKFGVDLPEDGMTWEQTVDLAKRVTRLDGDTQYRGLDPNGIGWIYQPLGIQAIDPDTGRAGVNNDQWKQVFELLKTIYTITGNERKGAALDNFVKDRTLAMLGYTNLFANLEEPTKSGFNWDVAQYPSYPERPDTYGNASVNVITVTKTGKYHDQAMQVVAIATSDEVQLENSKQGKISPLKNPDIKNAFGSGIDYLQGKRLTSIFKSKSVKYPLSSPYRSKAEGLVNAQFNEYLNGNIDVNTALKQAEEAINLMVQEEEAKK